MERLTERGKDGFALQKAFTHMGEVIDRLAEYEDAEEQGLLIRLPCKIGTPCYRIWQFGSAQKAIDWVFDYDDIPIWMCDTFPTREEAEESLKGRTLGG